MTDLQPRHETAPILAAAPRDDLILPLVGWVLVLVGWGLVGIIIAYVDRGAAPPHVRGSYRYLIRTFWIGCGFALLIGVGSLAMFGLAPDPARMMSAFFVLWLAIAAFGFWHLARCIKAIVLLARGQPIAHPGTWLV